MCVYFSRILLLFFLLLLFACHHILKIFNVENDIKINEREKLKILFLENQFLTQDLQPGQPGFAGRAINRRDRAKAGTK